MRMLWSDPMAYQQLAVALTAGIHHVSERVGARLLFSSSEATDQVREFFSRCSDESPWIAWDLQGFSRFSPAHYDQDFMPPVMVVSGDDDQLIRPSDADETGRFYQSGVHWVHRGSHMLMYDEGASDVSDWIGRWITRSLDR
jgi:pimeloyl-ACP methyl ester carboxylesterase